jgi:hypothetical protein
MRLIDFFVFYEATLYKNKEEENRTGNRRLGKAISIAGAIVGLWLTTVIQVIVFFVLKENLLINLKIWVKVYFIIAILSILILRYIYISKERYQYIISSQYRAFKLGRYTGAFVIFFLLIASVVLSVGIGIAMRDF